MRKDSHLEVGLRWRREEDAFDVSVEYDQPDDAEDRRDLGTTPVVVDTARLAQLVNDEAAYGHELAERLFASPQIRRFYTKAKSDAEQETDQRLHLRLLIDPNAPLRYHMLRWELLHDPDDEQPIALKRYILLSRYLSSSTWRSLSPPMRTDLRALVAIANPSDAATYGLAPVEVDVERVRARHALAGLGVARIAELVSEGDTRVTLNALLDVINEGVDVLYLVCHGRMDAESAWVYLQNPNGTTARCTADELVARVRELERRPMIALLCSCQSAGSGDHSSSDDGALAALGPRLAEAGVAAVVAMQGNITMTTAAEFFDEFFASLSGNGVVDYAMAVARGKVRDRADWWAPVLFSRLKRGRAWYQPEFGGESAPWQALVSQIKNEQCTPVVGPGLSSRLIGTRQEVARRWVERWQMPLAPHNLEDLAKVAQYLKVFYARGLLQAELKTCLITEFREQHPNLISEELSESRDLEKIYEVAGEWLRQQPDDPYTALAKLPLPIYVTTSWNRLLEAALDEADRPPIVEFFEWNRTRASRRARASEQPSVEHPLVYHLFGHFGDEDSLVLSEDDYFRWLTAWIKQSRTIPDAVKTAMTRRSLLFLGYHLDDWDFRVVFQAIKSFEGSDQLRDNVHVGVQLSPESSMFEPEAAQDYLERFFDNDKVSIFWGETERFLSELERRPERALMKRENPYVGPHAFERNNLLFGRDNEQRVLTDRLIAERVVLLHAPSGAGKTSLIQAGIVPALERERFGISGPLRVNTPPGPDVKNRYVWSTVVGLLNSTHAAAAHGATSLADAVQLREEQFEFADHVLIFDQFEEILSLNPTDWDGQEEFFDQLGEVLEDTRRWGLFSMREDYMGGLDRFLGQVPTHFETRFRLDFLERETQAVAAIRGPAERAGVVFDDETADVLARDLATLKVQRPGQDPEAIVGPYVEPVHLQVVCHRLWKTLAKQHPDGFDRIERRHLAYLGNFDTVLGDFYGDAVGELAHEAKVSERAIRDWFDTALLTKQGFRSQSTTGPDVGSTEVDVLARLERDHLVRSDVRGSTRWYELTHDRLIVPIRANNASWRRLNLNQWEWRAEEWERNAKRAGYLLRPNEVWQASRWLKEQGDNASDIEREFIAASKQASKHENLIKRFNVVVIALACVVMVQLAAIAYLLLRG